jgi:glycerophosphoryl diester phosphodiesterase
VVAHRGETFGAPENTMAAFELAAARGADAIELDVQLSSDGIPAVIHDRYLDRTTSGSGAVRSHTWAQLRRLDAGSWYDQRYRGQRIPSLGDVVEWARQTEIPLLVELKTHPFLDRGAAGLLARELGSEVDLPLALFSADHQLIRDLADALPEVPRGLMVNAHTPFLRRSLVGAGCSLLSQSFDAVTPATVAMAHGLGCLVASGIRQAGDLPTTLAWKVDLLVSDSMEVETVLSAVDGAALEAAGGS